VYGFVLCLDWNRGDGMALRGLVGFIQALSGSLLA
jgi:hypothetical protein